MRARRGSSGCAECEEDSLAANGRTQRAALRPGLARADMLAVRGEVDAQAVRVEAHIAHGGVERGGGIELESSELAAVQAQHRHALFIAGVHLVVAFAVGP